MREGWRGAGAKVLVCGEGFETVTRTAVTVPAVHSGGLFNLGPGDRDRRARRIRLDVLLHCYHLSRFGMQLLLVLTTARQRFYPLPDPSVVFRILRPWCREIGEPIF